MRAYTNDIFQREKLVLDPLQIEKNPVQQAIAKLFLNCLWGNFAQQLYLPKFKYLTEQEDLNKMLQDCNIQVEEIELLNNEN